MAAKKEAQTNKYIHKLKGPPILGPEVIADILESRPKYNALRAMSEKYGISKERIGRIWTEYYGGGKISDYKTGLKKPLPTEGIKTADITLRRIKTDRAEYVVKPPKLTKMDKLQDMKKRATPISKLKAVREEESEEDLELDDEGIEAMEDREASIVAGAVASGNNSQQMLEVMDRLIATNAHLSAGVLKTLKDVRRKAKAKYISSESESDYDNINESTDDSTAAYRPAKATPAKCKKPPEDDEGLWDHGYRDEGSEGPEEFEPYPRSRSTTNDDAGLRLRPSGISRVHGDDSRPQVIRQRTAGPSSRAKPIFAGVRERAEYGEEQGDHGPDFGYESALPPAQHNRRKVQFQQDNAHDGPQRNAQPGQGGRLPGPSRDGPCQTVQGVPWLARRAV